MFVHHVYFWLKENLTPEEKAKFKAGLVSLKAIETIQSAHIGVPASTNRGVIDASYSYSSLLLFNTAEDEEVYQKHPIHLKFVEDCASLWEKVIVYDSVDEL